MTVTVAVTVSVFADAAHLLSLFLRLGRYLLWTMSERLGERKSVPQGMSHFQWKRLIQTKHSVRVDRQGMSDADSKTESPDLIGYRVPLFFTPSKTLMH